MVFDTILNKGFLGSRPLPTQPFHNIVSCPEGQILNDAGLCVPIGTVPATTGFNWQQLSRTLSNVFDTLGNVFGSLVGNTNPNNMTPAQYQAYLLQQQQLKQTKILGMPAVPAAIMITLGLSVAAFLAYKAYIKPK